MRQVSFKICSVQSRLDRVAFNRLLTQGKQRFQTVISLDQDKAVAVLADTDWGKLPVF
jgi:hypothetical protein